jgi:nitroreductase
MMESFKCLLGRRSCRRFKQEAVDRTDLDRMIDAGRYAPTGYNKQAIRFAVISSAQKVCEAFAFTGWLTGTPPEGQRPAAYIVVLSDTTIAADATGAHCATYAVMLAAYSLGYGSCWHGCEGSEKVAQFLGLPAHLKPYILISLGKPDEDFCVHDPSSDWQVRKESDGTVHLGKRGRDEVTVAVL